MDNGYVQDWSTDFLDQGDLHGHGGRQDNLL